MAKISNLIAYPTVTPTLGDYVVGTDISDSNATVNYSFQSIADILPNQTLEEVLAEGNTATNNIILTGDISISGTYTGGNISISGTYGDTSGDVGTAGQVLSSTGTGTNWVDNVDGSGTLNTVAKWTPDGNTLGDSNITDNGTTINITSSASYFEVRASGGSEFETQVLFNARATTDNILHIADGLEDGAGDLGGSGQILSSVGTGVQWIDQLPSGLEYMGGWDANLNIPALASGVGTPGQYYIVKEDGTTNLDGNNTWEIGDWAIFSSTNVWQEIDNQNIFSGSGTVNTMTKWVGTQSLGDSNVTDDGTTIDIGDSTATTVTFSNTGNAEVAASVGTWRFNNTDVSFSPGVQLMDASAGPGTAGQVLSSTAAEVLWIDAPTGSGTLNYIPKWTPSGTVLGNSVLFDDGTNLTATVTNDITLTSGSDLELNNVGSGLSDKVRIWTDNPLGTNNYIDLNNTSGIDIDGVKLEVDTTAEIALTAGAALELDGASFAVGAASGAWVFDNASVRFNEPIIDQTGSIGVGGDVLKNDGTGKINWSAPASLTVGPDGSRSVSVTILSAALLNIGVTPIDLIPAPGGTKCLVVDDIYMYNDYGTVAYSNVGTVSGLFYSTSLTAGDIICQIPASFYTSGTGMRKNFFKPHDQTTILKNDKVVLANTTATNLLTGDGNFYVTLTYKILNAADMTPVLT